MSVAAPLTGLSSVHSLAQTPTAPAPGESSPMMQGMPPEMMQMMQMMRRMHSGAMSRMALMGGPPEMMPGGTLSNIEGHIAFLKAELKIIEPPKAWDAFADALRTNAKTLASAPNPIMGAMKQKMSGGSPRTTGKAAHFSVGGTQAVTCGARSVECGTNR
jgi:hypothetical protein